MIQQLLKIILDDVPEGQASASLTNLLPHVRELTVVEVDQLFDGLANYLDRNAERKRLVAENKAPSEDESSIENQETEAAPNITDQQQVDLQNVIHELVLREQARVAKSAKQPDGERKGWSDKRRLQVEQLYLATDPESDLRNHLLRWIATEGSAQSLQLWTNLLCNSPPQHRLGIVLAFAPVMTRTFEPEPWMLTELLENATSHSQIAPPVFDLLNFYFRHDKVETHPASARVDSLTNLLGSLVGQLAKIESGKFGPGMNAMKMNQQVSDSVALIVALCDAFALLDHKPAVPNLKLAMGLRHRRVQTEAAAALTRMDEEGGKETLVALAQQPVARMRVLAYAEELGFKDEISLELQGEIAVAESHLAIWLSEPNQMGLAPSDIQLEDNRELYWPGYEHPVQCYLFRYSYGTGEQAHSNIGICGPLTHAFAADMQGLSHDDIYAAFAGWQTIHHEIFQTELERARSIDAGKIASLESALKTVLEHEGDSTKDSDDDKESSDSAQPDEVKVGNFFGEWVLISAGSRDEVPGTVLVDSQKSSWIATGNPQAPIDWSLAWSIWKGRELLSNFNRQNADQA